MSTDKNYYSPNALLKLHSEKKTVEKRNSLPQWWRRFQLKKTQKRENGKWHINDADDDSRKSHNTVKVEGKWGKTKPNNNNRVWCGGDLQRPGKRYPFIWLLALKGAVEKKTNEPTNERDFSMFVFHFNRAFTSCYFLLQSIVAFPLTCWCPYSQLPVQQINSVWKVGSERFIE